MATQPTQNPVPSESPRDLKFNAGKVDEFVTSLALKYQDRFGNGHYTIEGLRQLAQEAIAAFGWITVDSFQEGSTLTLPNQVLRDQSNGEYYRWDGVLPKEVPVNSTPATTGGIGAGAWLSVGDAVLRGQLASPKGSSMVKASDGRTVQEWLIQSDSASYRAKNMAKLAWVDYQVHNRGSIKCCFLGDSITAGYDQVSTDVIPPQDGDWATRASMNYPTRFSQFLPEQSGCGVSVVMRAVSGYTAKKAYEKADWKTDPDCDIVFIMYGINDSGTVEGTTLNEYMDYMEKLIRRYIDWGCAVVVQRPAGGGQGAGNPAWLHWAKRMQMVARVYGCPIFDGHEVMLNRDYGAVQSDPIHYNSQGYAIHGEKLASMLMAGGLLDTYRPVVNETTVWPGMMSDHVGWCDTFGSIGTGRADGAFTRDRITGTLPKATKAITTFSFYLDAEAAHLYGKVSGVMSVYVSQWWVGTGQPYYVHSMETDVSYGASLRRTTKRATDYTGMYGSNKFLGRVVGRGWHTITFFNALDGTAEAEAFINSLTVQPIPVGLSTEQMWGQDEEKRYKTVSVKRLPSPAAQGSTLPPSVALNTFFLRVPQSLLGTGPGEFCLPRPYHYNTVPATLKIYSSDGVYLEYLIYKVAGANLKWAAKLLKSTLAAGAEPAISANLATSRRNTLVAAGAYGSRQPLESIYDFNGGIMEQSGLATEKDWRGGVYLNFTLTWPAPGSPTSYWTAELEGSDWFGNSESSTGAY